MTTYDRDLRIMKTAPSSRLGAGQARRLISFACGRYPASAHARDLQVETVAPLIKVVLRGESHLTLER